MLFPSHVLPGLNYGTTKNQHGEMEAALKGFLDAIVSNPNGKLSPAWYPAFESIIDQYLVSFPKASRSMARSTRLRATLRKWV